MIFKMGKGCNYLWKIWVKYWDSQNGYQRCPNLVSSELQNGQGMPFFVNNMSKLKRLTKLKIEMPKFSSSELQNGQVMPFFCEQYEYINEIP